MTATVALARLDGLAPDAPDVDQVLAAAWLATKRSPRTVSEYARNLEGFRTWVWRSYGHGLRLCKAFHMTAYHRELRDAGKSENSANTYLAAVCSFFNFADANDAYGAGWRNPGKGVTLHQGEGRDALLMYELVQATPRVIAAEPDERIRLFFEVMCLTAFRVSALARARVEDVKQSGGDFYLFAVEKGGLRKRRKISPETAKALRALDHRNGMLFGVSRMRATQWAARAAERAGVPGWSCHICRHFHATKLILAGWSLEAVAEAGGWVSTRVLAKHYQHLLGTLDADAPLREALNGNS